MAGLYYDPSVHDIFGKLIAGVEQGGLYAKTQHDLARQKRIAEGQKAIAENQRQGLYAPTMREDVQTVWPEGANAPDQLNEQAIQVPVAPKRSMLSDMRDMYLGAGDVANAMQVDQMMKLEKQLNTQEGTQALQTYATIKKAFGKKSLPPELNQIFADTFPSFRGVDLNKLTPTGDGFSVLKYPIDGQTSAVLYDDPESGERKVQIVQEKPDVENKPYQDANGQIVLVNVKDPKANELINQQGLKPYGAASDRPYKVGEIISKDEGEETVNYKVTGYDEKNMPVMEVFSRAPRYRPRNEPADPFDKALVTKTLTELPKLRSEAINQSNNINRINRALQLVETGVTGKGGQVKAWLAPYAEMVGTVPENMSDAQLFQMLTRVIVGPMRLDIIGPGPVSEWEQKLMQQISGGGGASQQAARELLGYYKQQATTKVKNYNDTLEGVKQIAPNTGKVYQPIEVKAPETPAPAPSSTGGRIKVKSPSGALGTIPESQLNDALKQGYKRAD